MLTRIEPSDQCERFNLELKQFRNIIWLVYSSKSNLQQGYFIVRSTPNTN
jgi:hypothetical protein